MPENTKEKDIILKNLDYIGLNLEELPDFLTIYKDVDFISVENEFVSEDIFARGLCLPSDIKMTEDEQNYVISVIKSYFNKMG